MAGFIRSKFISAVKLAVTLGDEQLSKRQVLDMLLSIAGDIGDDGGGA